MQMFLFKCFHEYLLNRFEYFSKSIMSVWYRKCMGNLYNPINHRPMWLLLFPPTAVCENCSHLHPQHHLIIPPHSNSKQGCIVFNPNLYFLAVSSIQNPVMKFLVICALSLLMWFFKSFPSFPGALCLQNFMDLIASLLTVISIELSLLFIKIT